MNRKLYGFVAAALLIAGGADFGRAEDMSMDPTTVGPNIYKKVFENDRVRVFEVTFKPGDKIGMHSHPDHFAYAISSGALKIMTPDGKTVDANGQPGQVFWMTAQSHSAENVGSTTFKLLVTELKGMDGKMKGDMMKEKKKQ